MPYAENNGVRIHFKIEGEGTPLVLQHGFMATLDVWNDYSYVDSLKNDYQLILIDLRGHGLSDKPTDSKVYTMNVLASDVIAVLDELEIDKAHFWGYSMGGHIGFGLSKYYPKRFFSFMLGGISPQNISDEIMETIKRYHTRFKEGAEGYLAHMESAGTIITPEIEEEIRSFDFDALYAFWGADIFKEDYSHLSQLTTPILLYSGENDEWGHYPRAVEAAKMYANITLVTFPNEGHGVQSQKELVLLSVLEFLEHQ